MDPKSKRKFWMLFVLTWVYIIGELGHFIIGTVSKEISRELKYGDESCFPIKGQDEVNHEVCKDLENITSCEYHVNSEGEKTCYWDYNGLGLSYQILAGPSFILVFTITGIFWGIGADRYNRVRLLTAATLLFSSAIALTCLAQEYWHLVILRMLLAAGEAGCAPIASGMLSDVFDQGQRALAMSLFNWGIYIGSGFSFAIGTYVTAADIFGQSWRASFLISGIPGIIIALVLFLTISDPPRIQTQTQRSGSKKVENQDIFEENSTRISYNDIEEKSKIIEILKIFLRPEILVLGLAACIRHTAGFSWGYNSALYFQTYYPDIDSGWWLTGKTIFGGAFGAAFGGYISDKLVNRLGVTSRALVLGLSQFIASPFLFAVFYLDPPWAFISLICGYILGEMWFGVMYAILVELLPVNLKSTGIGVSLFIITNFGGNVPVLVDEISTWLDNYRTAIVIMYPGAIFTSSILFFICCILLHRKNST